MEKTDFDTQCLENGFRYILWKWIHTMENGFSIHNVEKRISIHNVEKRISIHIVEMDTQC